ncbi:MAG: hypothetical protein MUF40_02790 [Gemmatimonadaceae bacterium]|nr:hypothetical protein [Gemmatimonadaceae bacterium]
MPAEILTDIDHFVHALVGFWRFVFSRAYRAATIERWRQRAGVKHLLTLGEVTIAPFLGLVFPLAVVYFTLLRPTS